MLLVVSAASLARRLRVIRMESAGGGRVLTYFGVGTDGNPNLATGSSRDFGQHQGEMEVSAVEGCSMDVEERAEGVVETDAVIDWEQAVKEDAED
jgi:hypothetical protein